MIDAAPAPLIEELVPAPDPVSCCERLGGLPHRVFLDSALASAATGRYSFLSADPIAIVRAKGDRVALESASGTAAFSGDALEAVSACLRPHRTRTVDGVPPFQGGAIGYVSYDWGRTLERLPEPTYDDLDLPDVAFGIYDWTLAWDHHESRAWIVSTGMPEVEPEARRRRARERAAAVRAWLDAPRPTLRPTTMAQAGRLEAPSFPAEHPWGSRLSLRSSFTEPTYLEAIERIRSYIVAGDVFQVNLSQRFEAALTASPWSLYTLLRSTNAAPFAAFLDLPEAAILSASPERFLHVAPDGRVETRPVKGTRPRSEDPDEDAAFAAALLASEKDRAENLMIVDLMRNDLSRVCGPGTVGASDLCALERYATVHHLVSTVTGRLEADRSIADLIRAAFPPGSVTGAPKIRAIEIITELEPSARSVYCGTIGYWSVTGAFDGSVAIRTAICRNGRIYFSAGGGVVADSDPGQEYRETLDKARGIAAALTSA